jgi:hypothetical protein
MAAQPTSIGVRPSSRTQKLGTPGLFAQLCPKYRSQSSHLDQDQGFHRRYDFPHPTVPQGSNSVPRQALFI